MGRKMTLRYKVGKRNGYLSQWKSPGFPLFLTRESGDFLYGEIATFTCWLILTKEAQNE
jgi:hypothetical protein